MGVLDLKAIEPILRQYPVEYAGIFGSHARGEAHEDSDVDILVKFNDSIGLFKFIGLEQDLSEALRKKVDLVTERSLHPYIRDNVLKDLKVFYGRR